MPEQAHIAIPLDSTFARIVVESMPVALTVYDAGGRTLYHNDMARSILGLDDEEMGERTSYDPRWQTIHENGSRFSPEDYPVNKTLRTGESFRNVTMGINRPDGTCSWILINSEPIFAIDDRTPAAVVVAFVDITEQVTPRKELYEAQKLDAVGKLSAGVAHDVRNLLQMVNASCEYLHRIGVAALAPAQLASMRNAIARGTDLTEQLLAVGRQNVIRPKPLDLGAVVASSLELFRPLISAEIRVEVRSQDDLWPVEADESLVGQVVMNLLLNALDAMPGAGSLLMETCNFTADEAFCRTHRDCIPGDYGVLTVTDSGSGMSEEVRRQIFDPYFSTKGGKEHAGLGLAVVFGIVRQQRGRISVHSEPGKGTSFAVFFPRAPDVS